MNFYVNIINETVNYIEDNIQEKLSLSALSKQFGISDFHFNRIFKTITGFTMKRYILGRKLTKASELLKDTNQSVIEIAYELGFEYPEVFSRAFKKQFGISPTNYRDNRSELECIKRAYVAERDIINYRGVLALKGEFIYLKEHSLYGVSVDTNTKEEEFEKQLRDSTEEFVRNSANEEFMLQENLYTVVNCHGNDDGNYTVFCGKKILLGANPNGYMKRLIPGGWYVVFQYYGDIFNLREAFVDDLYRWIMVKEAKLRSNGIGMINIYHKDYPKDDSISILVPVEHEE